jgi:hypothetical protein
VVVLGWQTIQHCHGDFFVVDSDAHGLQLLSQLLHAVDICQYPFTIRHRHSIETSASGQFVQQTGALENILDGQTHFGSAFGATDVLQMFIAERKADHSLGLGIFLPELGSGGGIQHNIRRSNVEDDFIELTESEDQLDLLLPGVLVACGELVDLESADTATLIHDT